MRILDKNKCFVKSFFQQNDFRESRKCSKYQFLIKYLSSSIFISIKSLKEIF